MTDSVSKSGLRFSAGCLEDILWQTYGQYVPTNLSHDIHRPLGITQISSLYISHENSYLLGHTYLPEDQDEIKQMMTARTNYLNRQVVERVNQYSLDFLTELRDSNLLKEGGSLMSNGVVMYGSENITFEAFPDLKENVDKDGLIYLKTILASFDYKGEGVFASKKNKLSIMVHPYLRRSFSRHNSFNKGFLKVLFNADTENTPVRIRIDPDFIGYTPSYIETQEFDFWFGPKYTDDISNIKKGVTTYVTNQEEYCYNQIKKTEFVWQDKDGKLQFEMEEVTDVEAPTLTDDTYGCRYLHSIYDTANSKFDHFDGAIRSYDLEAICNRLDKPIDAMGHSAQYIKIFRIDGTLPIHLWKSLISHYLKGNQDVYRYFDEPVPYQKEQEHSVNPVSRYVPFILKPGDGVRILYSYHAPTEQDCERCYMDFDTCCLEEGIVETTDLTAMELAKCIHRAGGDIDYPSCRYILYHDNFHDIPEIYHGSDNPAPAVRKTLEGINILLDGEMKNGVEDCLSFCLSWKMEDKKVKVCFIGAVPDLQQWFKTFESIPTDRDSLKKWLENQVQYIKNHGQDTPSPANASYIHSNGIFYHRRRLIQQDVLINDLCLNEKGEISAKMEFTEDKRKLAELVQSGIIQYAPYIVADSLLYDGDKDYLKSDKIAILGEIVYWPKIHFMNFVWSSQQNALRELYNF